MSDQEQGHVRRRASLAAVLSVLAVALFVLDSSLPAPAGEVPRSVPPGTPHVEEAVDTMMARYGIERAAVKTWRILSADKRPIRVEQRITVPREFPTLVFNYQLQQLLSPSGVTVVATERSRDFVVTMHLVRDGRTVRSIAFYLMPDDSSAPARTAMKRRSS